VHERALQGKYLSDLFHDFFPSIPNEVVDRSRVGGANPFKEVRAVWDRLMALFLNRGHAVMSSLALKMRARDCWVLFTREEIQVDINTQEAHYPKRKATQTSTRFDLRLANEAC